jgi:peptidoglycan hydrolase-like amidase
MYHKITRLSYTIALIMASFFIFDFSYAKEPGVVVKDPGGYSAKYVGQSIPDPIEIEAGALKTVSIEFKNTGTATWSSNANRYISAYTMEPRERTSVFSSSQWKSQKQTSAISGTVAPGKTGKLNIELKAPVKTGDYVEKFYLASENYSWVKGGYFFLKIKVIEKKAVKEPLAENSQNNLPAVSDYTGKSLGQNLKAVEAKGGDKLNFVVIFQNTGNSAWKKYSITEQSGSADTGQSVFADFSWKDKTTVFEKTEEVASSASIRNEFTFRAPKTKGSYIAVFSLVENGTSVQGAEVKVNVLITEDASSNYVEPFTQNSSSEIKEDNFVPRLASEPIIRVGLEQATEFTQFRSEEDDYFVYSGTEQKGILSKTYLGVVKYADGKYFFTSPQFSFESEKYIRLAPVNNQRAVFWIPNFIRNVSWKGPDNFNQYRGAFEYRKGDVDGKMYAVNELLLEDYIAGIAETSNNAPAEYIKALLVAARSYAYKSIGKYSFFDVVGNTYDQLYLGYVSEALMPNVVQAEKNTRGQMVVYENEIVTTPYFANSNGKTKSWISVWGGRAAKPWLVPVVCKYDAGQPQRGHGVGMSARDAALRAEKEGLSWQDLIKYYYTGVEVEMAY